MKIDEYQIDDVKFIKIDNENNFEVVLSNLGAGIYSIKYFDEYMNKFPLSVSDLKRRDLFHGKTVGRTCNRLPGNKIVLDDKEYFLMNNEGDNTLHGGLEGLSNQYFNYEIVDSNDIVKVRFTYLSKDGESGYPGNMIVKVLYVFSKLPNIDLSFAATTDKTTIINLTNHTFFSLGERNLDNLTLEIDADEYLKTDKDTLLPVKRMKVTKALDFRKMKLIVKSINDKSLMNHRARGYDHFFYLKDRDFLPHIILESPKYRLCISTSFRGVQIYTDNYEDGAKFNDTDELLRRSIAIEPSDPVNEYTTLRNDEIYIRHITYAFERK